MKTQYISARQRGAILPLATVALVVLFGFLALALDVGYMVWRKSQYQTALDAAALSAAHCHFVDGQEEPEAAACGDKTFRYNMQAFGLMDYVEPAAAPMMAKMSSLSRQSKAPETEKPDPEKPQEKPQPVVYEWHTEKSMVELTKKTLRLPTAFAGQFMSMFESGNDGSSLFKTTVYSRAGFPKQISTGDSLPLVVDWSELCKGDETPCASKDFKLTSVRAWALLPEDPKEDVEDKAQALFDWLAGDPESRQELSFGQQYLVCVGDDCDHKSGLSENKGDEYEDAIEDGLEARMECDEDRDDKDDDDRDDFPYVCERNSNGEIAKGYYPPDFLEDELDDEHDDHKDHFFCDEHKTEPYKKYFKHTETVCATPKDDFDKDAGICGSNKECRDDHECWEHDDGGIPESYRRVIMASIGNVDTKKSTAIPQALGCFVLADVDDPGEKGSDDGIELVYIPQGTPEAKAAGCKYSDDLNSGTGSIQQQRVVLMGDE